MQPSIESFKHWLFEEGRSPRTIESYGSDIKGFQQFLTEKAVGEEQPLSRFSFVRFKEHLMKEEYAVSSINKMINSLKVYNDYLRTIGVLSDSIVVLKRR
ncbi:site-specific integrase [Sporosarcina sp. FA15]|uniref:site-specific integrase n=1 Tax=Sporosarcina sp. FA15 TaxID=3413031 RepID=UPI003F65F617